MFRAQHRLGGKSDILLAIGALDDADLSKSLGQREPSAQIVIGDVAGEVPLVDHRCHQPFDAQDNAVQSILSDEKPKVQCGSDAGPALP
jgi:hypothetical protein